METQKDTPPMRTILLLWFVSLLTLSAPLTAQDIPATPITLSNVEQVKPLLRLGRGQPTLTQFSADGMRLVVGSTVGVWVYDVTDLDAEPQYFSMDISATALAFSPTGGLLAVGAGDGTGRVYDLTSGQQLDYVIAGPVPERGAMANFNVPARGVRFSTTPGMGHKNDGSGAVSSTGVTDSDGTVLYLDILMGGGAIEAEESHANGLTAQIIDHEVHISDGIGDHTLTGFTPRIGFATMNSDTISTWVGDAVSLPENALMTMGGDSLMVWDVDTGAVIHESAVEAIPDELLIARWEGGVAQLDSVSAIRVTEGDSEPFTLTNNARVTSLAFRPDGMFLAAGEYNSTLTLWDMATREVFTSQYAHFGAVMTLDWSPDGTILYSGGEENRVFAWELTEDKEFPLKSAAFIGSHAAPVIELWALDDGARLVSVSMDGTVIVWGIP